MNFDPKDTNNYREATLKTMPLNLQNKKECRWCKQMKLRSSGRWVTKTVWMCKDCVDKEERND